MTRIATAALLVGVVAIACVPGVARAQSIEAFEACRAAYEARDFARAVQCFEQLVGSDDTSDDSLVIEGRKYLGAAYLFLGRRDAAIHQFEVLLARRPDYLLDPVLFPAAIQEAFGSVRTHMAEEARAAAERRDLEARLARERERSRALLALAAEPVTIEVERSRWAALVPWGVGQFLNGDEGLGWMFFATETVLLGVAFTSLAIHDSVFGQVPAAFANHDDAAIARANEYLLASAVTNWISLGSLAILAIAGIVEAQLSFQPTAQVRRDREVPDELREGLDTDEPMPQEPGPAVTVGPSGIRF